jgi:hypothetical protein
MSILRWRFLVGPLVTIVAGVWFLLIDRYLYSVPTPGSLLFFSVLFAAYVGGVIPGLVSAAFCLTFSAILCPSQDSSWLRPGNLKRWIVLALLAPATQPLGLQMRPCSEKRPWRRTAVDTVRARDQVDWRSSPSRFARAIDERAIFRNGALRQHPARTAISHCW